MPIEAMATETYFVRSDAAHPVCTIGIPANSYTNCRLPATLGIGAAGRLLVVVFTWRGQNIRIISARPAEPHEHDEYEAGL